MPTPGLAPPAALPPLPAPAGRLNPQPTPAAPTVPAGEPNILSGNRPRTYEPKVVPASAPADGGRVDPATLPPLPDSLPQLPPG